MERNILTDYYRPLLERNDFRPIPCGDRFSPAGRRWEIAPAVGSGDYWVYAKRDLFDIKIHDFCFHEDFCLDVEIPEGISILRYDSISGEELAPYRRLSAGGIQRPSWAGSGGNGRSSTSASSSAPWALRSFRPITRSF